MQIHYDSETHQYVDENGQPVDKEEIHKWILVALASFGLDLRHETQMLIDSQVTIEEWRIAMGQDVEALHSAMFQAGIGGSQNMTSTLQTSLDTIIAKQDQYLDGFESELQAATAEDGTIQLEGNLSADSILNRASLYADAGFSTFENGRRALAAELIDSGDYLNAIGLFGQSPNISGDLKVEEIRRLETGIHHCPECPEIAGIWSDVGTLPDIGETVCMVNCHCWFDYRIVSTAQPVAA